MASCLERGSLQKSDGGGGLGVEASQHVLLQVLKGSHKLGRIEHKRVGDQVGADTERVEQVMKVWSTTCYNSTHINKHLS